MTPMSARPPGFSPGRGVGALAAVAVAAVVCARRWLAAPATVARPTVRCRPSRRPSANLLFGWTFEPLVLLPLVGCGGRLARGSSVR